MFTFRNVLRIVYDDHRSFFMLLYKSTKCNSKVSVVKTFNTENKHLYGNLIETQKQRRAKILKKKKEEDTFKKMGLSESANFTAEITVDQSSVEKTTTKPTTKKTKKVKQSKSISKSKKGVLPDDNTITVNKVLNSRKPSIVLSKLNKVDSSNLLNMENNISSNNEIPQTIKNKNIQTVSANLRVDLIKTSKTSEHNNLSDLTEFPLENSQKDFSFCNTVSDTVSEIKRITLDDPEVKNKFSNFPSVSKIISATMPESSLAALKRWRTKMIAELGEEGFQAHYKAQLNRGSEFHETIRKKLMGEAMSSNTEAITASMNSLKWVWPLLSSTVAVESHIAHPQLCYRGVIDCVAKFKETPVVIEWKLSDKLKPQIQDTYDAPVQLSAYVGAFNYDNNFKFQINHGLVVVAYSSGSPADAFFLSPKHCQAYWKIWLARLNKFNNIGHLHTDHEIPTVI